MWSGRGCLVSRVMLVCGSLAVPRLLLSLLCVVWMHGQNVCRLSRERRCLSSAIIYDIVLTVAVAEAKDAVVGVRQVHVRRRRVMYSWTCLRKSFEFSSVCSVLSSQEDRGSRSFDKDFVRFYLNNIRATDNYKWKVGGSVGTVLQFFFALE